MNYLYSDFNYDEVEKIKEYFEIKDVKYDGCVNNEGIIIDFAYNNRMYRYRRLIMTKSISIEIRDLETSIDITDKPYVFVGETPPVSKETLKDWIYINLIFDLIRLHIDDADGCKHLVSLSYQDFKDDPKVKTIINIGILLNSCIVYSNNIYYSLMDFRSIWARDGIYTAYYLIKMNHPLMEMVKQYPEYKPDFVKVVEAARRLGLHEEQLIISDFVASIQESPDKWEL